MTLFHPPRDAAFFPSLPILIGKACPPTLLALPGRARPEVTPPDAIEAKPQSWLLMPSMDRSAGVVGLLSELVSSTPRKKGITMSPTCTWTCDSATRVSSEEDLLDNHSAHINDSRRHPSSVSLNNRLVLEWFPLTSPFNRLYDTIRHIHIDCFSELAKAIALFRLACPQGDIPDEDRWRFFDGSIGPSAVSKIWW
jgi:hypothetical protein